MIDQTSLIWSIAFWHFFPSLDSLEYPTYLTTHKIKIKIIIIIIIIISINGLVDMVQKQPLHGPIVKHETTNLTLFTKV